MHSRRTFLGVLGGASVAVGAGVALFGRVGGDSGGDGGERPVNALVAGSLLRLARQVPGATVEAHGSATVRRFVVDGLRTPDVVALADPALFDGVAETTTLFATNALVLAYDPDAPHAPRIESDWARAVAADDVAVGRTDPDLDPLGYRTVMALRLAARRGLVADDVASTLDGMRTFPEVDLLNALEGGALDAAFVYRNMALQRDLPMVSLPTAIDFSDPERERQYATVSYDLDGRRVVGAPIRYGATATTDHGDPWVDALVSDTERLRRAGFVVPEDYPRRGVTVPLAGV